MDSSRRKEHLSLAYVRAVAAAAGFGVTVPDIDDDSVDVELSAKSVQGLRLRPRVEAQVKSTTVSEFRKDNHLVYELKRKNYDELIVTNLLVPRILIVVRLPEAEEEWLRHSEEELAMRHCGYWVSIAGRDETTNNRTVSIAIPRSHVFDVPALKGLMGRAARREPL